jgi:hypothetical protein
VNADVLAHSWGVFFMFSSVRQKVCFLVYIEPAHQDRPCIVQQNNRKKKDEQIAARLFAFTFLWL